MFFVGVFSSFMAGLLEQTKAEKEQGKKELFNLLTSQPTNTIQAICKLSKDKELKATAKTALSLPLVEKEVINELIRANPAAFNTGENNRILRDLVFLVGYGGNDLATAIQKIANQSKKQLTLERDTHQRKERIKTYKNNPKEQSSEARAQVEREKAICLKFKYILNNIQKGKRKNEFTAIELAKIVNSALDSVVLDGKAIRTPKKIGGKAVVSYLSQFYEIEQKQTGGNKGRIYIYIISKPKRLG